MNPGLFQCLTEERSIFRIFDASRTMGDYEAFHSPRHESIAHWNLAYPAQPTKLKPSSDEVVDLLEHYAQQDLEGHVIMTDPHMSSRAAEECEYFRLDGPVRKRWGSQAETLRHRPEDLHLFASIIQACFILSDSSKTAFLAKMEKLRAHEGSHFYVLENQQSQIIGCANTIRTSSGADFLFNIGTRPEFNDLSYFDAILTYIAQRSSRPLYTYHRSSLMRNQVLRPAGFAPLGVVYCVPLLSLMKEKE
ncbi:MAG: hypothetical protein NDI61_12790 [Bdellovibrionaceae bacterium]|nr:hypothetical protein [Pseudobdellovibrionaceae bacterium]